MSEPAKPTTQSLFAEALARHEAGDFPAAEALYRRFLARKPDHAGAWTNLGAVLRSRGRLGPAIAAHRRAIEIEPRMTTARSNLATALRHHGDIAEAVALRTALLAEAPDDWIRIRDLAHIYRAARRDADAIRLIDAAEARLGPNETGQLERGLARLMLGDYAAGFRDYESRYAGGEVALPEGAPWPRWTGQPIDGKRLLVMPEQGFGDAILMARFLPRLKEMGADVTLIAKPPLQRLFAGLEGVDRLVSGVKRSDAFDFYTPNMSLPHLVGMPGGAPPPPPRLTLPDDSVARARRLVAPFRDRFRIGILWTGSLTYRGNHRRSTRPESFLRLAEVPGVQLFSLYKGDAHDAFLDSGMAGLVVDACGADRDFADSAAVIAEMDLMITTDSAVVHVAASLGKPVWNLLAWEGYWLYGEAETTPWYPSMRLFRQPRPGDWEALFARVETALRDRLAATGGTVSVAVAPGELIDKITILEIKSERIAEPAKLANVATELATLVARRDATLTASAELDRLSADLKSVNEALWEIEDDIRDCDRAGDFGPRFVELARSVYRTNDKRMELKRRINTLLGSNLIEEKSYRPY
jgi:hypothetical protein